MAVLIAAQRDEHGIPAALACRALGVSRSWFYKHEDAVLPPRAARHEELGAAVRRLFAAHEGKYGSPRITADLRDEGWAVSKNTVAAVMREQGLAARRKKKRKATTRPGRGRWRRRTWSSGTSRRGRSTSSGTATALRSLPARASSISPRSWMWPRAGCWGSPCLSITTRSWPMARWRWPWRCAAAGARGDHAYRPGQRYTARLFRPPAPGFPSPSRWAGPARRWITR